MYLRLFSSLLLLILTATSASYSQSVRLVRNDVDSTRAHFTTATFRFGVNVTLQDVEGCNGASFELRFTQAQYIRYSGYSRGDFGSDAGIVVIDRSDIATGDGRLYVGVVSGKPAGTQGFDNPVVVRLDFVVAPNAPHNEFSHFTFIGPKAVTNKDGGSVQDLRGDNLTLAIRSYIDIWPGDANNDGIVYIDDISTIGNFLTDSENQGPYRGFKRQPASTYWIPQNALSWDSIIATSADCDGSGEVTQNDILVVQHNFSKRRTNGKMPQNDVPLGTRPYINPQPFPLPFARRVPVYVRAKREFTGAAVRIGWSAANARGKVVGVEPGESFAGGDILCFSKIYERSRSVDIVVGTINADSELPGHRRVVGPADKMLLCYLVVDSLGTDAFPLQMLQHPTGITASGQFFPLELAPLSVENTGKGASFSASVRKSHIVVESETETGFSVQFFDALGRETGVAQHHEITSKTAAIPLPVCASGVYFAMISAGENVVILPVVSH